MGSSNGNGHTEVRRIQVMVSPEVQALLKLGAILGNPTCVAVMAARGSEHRAAVVLGVTPAVLRQRIARMVSKVEAAFPEFRLARGPAARLTFGYGDEELARLAGDRGS